MNGRYRHFAAIVVLVLAVPITAVGQEQSVSVGRQQIVQSLQGNIVLSSELEESLSPQAAKDLIANAQKMIGEQAGKLLPDELKYSSYSGSIGATNNGLLLRYDDPEYLLLTVTKSLMDMKVDNEFQKLRVSSMNDGLKSQLKENVETYVTAVQASMEKNLVGSGLGYTKEEIAAGVGEIRNMLIAQIDNPSTYWMTASLTKDQAAELGSQFEARLAAGKEGMEAKIKEAIARGSSEQDMVQFRKGLLGEITRAGSHAMLRASTSPEIKAIGPDKLVPGYAQVTKRLDEIESPLWRVQSDKIRTDKAQKRNGREIAAIGKAALNERISHIRSVTTFPSKQIPATDKAESKSNELQEVRQITVSQNEKTENHSNSPLFWITLASASVVGICCCALVATIRRNRRRNAAG